MSELVTILVSYSPKKKKYVGITAGLNRDIRTWKTVEEIVQFAEETGAIIAFQAKTLKRITDCP